MLNSNSLLRSLLLTLLCWLICRVVVNVEALLLFPASSVLQITASLAVPVVLPGRKLYMDWGFQFNWDLPWNPASFYDLPTFENTLTGRKSRELQNLTDVEDFADFNERMLANGTDKWRPLEKYSTGNNEIHTHDFTAGELYESLENLLVRYGFHESCLLRSVCELARHPFADDQQNLLTELLTFILTPSLHAAFAPTETVYRTVYEEAERSGFLGHDCGRLYAECKQDILHGMTRIVLDM